jgi:hypothetical protein
MRVAAVVLVVALLSGCAGQQTVDEWADENYDVLTGLTAAVVEANTAFENGIDTNSVRAESHRFRFLSDRLDAWLSEARELEPIPAAAIEAEWREALRAMRDASSAIRIVAASEFSTDLVLEAMDELNYAAGEFADVKAYLP